MGKRAIIISLCVLAFGGGLLAGYLRVREKPVQERAPVQEPVEVDAEAAEVAQTPTERALEKTIDYYTVKSDENYIVIYEVYTDQSTHEIDRCEAEISMLPKEDREMLARGINVSSTSEAAKKIEDFTS